LSPHVFFLLESAPPGRVFGIDMQTLIGMGITFLNIAFLSFMLSYLLYKPVREFLLKRTMRIREQLQFAEQEQAKGTELKQQYEQKMKDIERERNDILDAARKQAADKTKQQLAEARSEAEATKARAFQEIELEQERVQDEMKKAIIDISSAMTAKFLSRAIDADTQEKLFNETMAELEEIAWHS